MRVLGIDYGERRIGIAVSDPTGTLARPVGAIPGDANQAIAVARVIEQVAKLEQDDEPVSLVVVGLPRRLDGSANQQTPRVEAFAELLRARAGRPVVLQDERLTSHEADRLLAMHERDWRERKRRLDAAAAAVILQEYLDGHRTAMPDGIGD
ncbi:MAG: Holliday junction resolvase RuvX [Acidobacteria bacterium]|nr:Holliday junction resolvase RuvX [Acidobacteriota bacterium]